TIHINLPTTNTNSTTSQISSKSPLPNFPPIFLSPQTLH
ncbi:hypothetical protein, partial [Staphylococcus saprophyticus]